MKIILSALAAIFLFAAAASAQAPGTINQLQQWIVSAGQVRLASTTADVRVPSLDNCDTIDTDANGLFSCGTDSGGGGAGSGTVGTSTAITPGHVAYFMNQSGLSSIATGTLSESVTGLEFDAARLLLGGSAALSLTSGFEIPLSASTTEWAGFYLTPSTRITAGTGIDWSGNTLNGVYTAGDGITLTTEDFDCDTANASTFGCLTSTNWSTFNDKIGSTSLSVSDSSQIDLGYTSATGVFTADIVANSIGDSQLAFDTGQTLTTAGTPTFAGLTLSSPLTVPNGGTGVATLTAGGVVTGNGTGALFTTATGTVSGTGGVTVTAARAALGGALAIDCTVSSASAAGCLSTTNWSTFNNKISSTSLSFTDTGRIDGTYTSGSGVITADIVADSISDTYLAFNTGQHLTTTSEVTFAEATTTQFFSSVASSTLANFINASSTTFFSYIASSTNLFSSVGTFFDKLRMPWKAANTFDAAGQIAGDTSDNQFHIATGTNGFPAVAIPNIERHILWSRTYASTSPYCFSGVAAPLPEKRDGFTLEEVYCKTTRGGSIPINLSNGAGTADTESITCDDNGGSDTDITTNAVFAAGATTTLECGALTGTPHSLDITVYGSWTAE